MLRSDHRGKSRLRTEVQEPQSFMGNGVSVCIDDRCRRSVPGMWEESPIELVFWRGLPLVVWERRCKSLVCNRAPPPWEQLLTRGDWRRRGPPRGRGAGFSGCDLWNSSVRAGSRMSLALTQDLSSGPYPSQSISYWSIPPRRRESRSSLTW